MEVIIHDDCSFDKAYSIANILTKNFNLFFSKKLNDLESFYWDFEYKGNRLTLHYNIFVGLSIFPMTFKKASDADNNSVVEISSLLSKYLIENNME